MDTSRKNYFSAGGGSTFGGKYYLMLILCLFARLIPFRAPNVEPILATAMPFSKIYGAFATFSFAVLSIFLYDLLTHTLGVQTFFTLSAYGLVALLSASYFQHREANVKNYVCFAIVGTLLFDALTGLTVGPIFFHQSFMLSLVGQIPFTALHLAGNIAFAIVLSPVIYSFVIKKRKREKISYIDILNPKTI